MDNKKSIAAAAIIAASACTAYYLASRHKKSEDEDFDVSSFKWDDPESINQLDHDIYNLSQQYTEEASKLLKELIRIPADYYEQDPLSGTSNHEGPRLEYLKQAIINLKAVLRPEDVDFDEFGSLVWTVTDPDDPTPIEEKKVIYFDGHSDTVYPLRDDWHDQLGNGIDCFNGLTEPNEVNEESLQQELRYVPPKDKWDHLIFGRGSADQLQGVVSQVFATKILLETRNLGSLRGVIVRSIATIAEEDNDGGAPMHILRKQSLKRHQIPDCVVITEGTGDIDLGPCGIYIGQRGRCQVEVEVIGQSCHGSMPTQGINPLEYGTLIIAEAAEQSKFGFEKKNKFLGNGTRTASWCKLDTPSDCAVPAKFTIRFDRRLTKGEDAEMACNEIEGLKSVADARQAGCTVNIRIPLYTEKSHKGVPADNPQDYLGWVTPPTNPVVLAAVEAYKRTVTPHVEEPAKPGPDDLRKNPRVQRWIFSTDGVGYPLPKDTTLDIKGKGWIESGNHVHPPMFGIGAGYEHHCHKLGEYVHKDHLWCPIAVMSRFPSLFVEKRGQLDE